LEIRESLVRDRPGDDRDRADLAASLAHVGFLCIATRRGPEAVAAYARAVEIRAALAARDPGSATRRRDLAAAPDWLSVAHSAPRPRGRRRRGRCVRPPRPVGAGCVRGPATRRPGAPWPRPTPPSRWSWRPSAGRGRPARRAGPPCWSASPWRGPTPRRRGRR